MQDYSLNFIRRSVGFVLQQAHIFPGSIFENIRSGNLNATDEEVIETAKKAGLHDNEHYRSIIDANIENMNIEQLISVRKNALF